MIGIGIGISITIPVSMGMVRRVGEGGISRIFRVREQDAAFLETFPDGA